MPLITGKSKASFNSNVREMVKAGHALKQSLAAAYSQKRKAQRLHKMWVGGPVLSDEMSQSDIEKDVKERYWAGGPVLSDEESESDIEHDYSDHVGSHRTERDDEDDEEKYSKGGRIPFAKALRLRRIK